MNKKLTPEIVQTISQNEAAASIVLLHSKAQNTVINGLKQQGLGKISNNDNLISTFDDNLKKYNKGISDDEIRAWVWYKSNLPLNKGGEIYEGAWQQYKTPLGSNQIKDFVKKGILFYSNKEHLPYAIYAFGNMYDREIQLNIDKEHIVDNYGVTVFEKQKEIISNAKPPLLSILNPDINERPKILAISNFARQFVVPTIREEYTTQIYNDVETAYYQNTDDVKNTNCTLIEWFNVWLYFMTNNHKSQFENCSAWEIWNYYILNRSLSRSMSDSNKDRILQFAGLEGEKLFQKFLNEALRFEDQQKFDFTWNRLYNGYSALPYSRIPIAFESSAMFKTAPLQISDIQREGVAFMKASGSGILAYDVGVGKTMTAIVTLACDIYSGKTKRPLIVVPNAVYKKWIREIVGYYDDDGQFIYGVLSGTGIEVNDFYNLGTDAVGRLEREKKIKTDKYGNIEFQNIPPKSITIVTYEGFMKIGFSSKIMDGLFVQLSEALAQANDKESKRDIEKEMERYREIVGLGNKGSIVDIDQLKVDYIVIDEAHNFKNVFKYTPTDEDGNKRFKIEGSQSSRAIKAYFMCNYVQRTYGSNIMLMTATPFTNNPLEVYSMLALTGHEELKEYGLINLYNFMETFILQSWEYTNSYDGSIVKKNVVKAFNNRLILQKLIFNKINYKTGEEAGVKRPCKINLPRLYKNEHSGELIKLPKDQQLVTYLLMTQKQQENQDYLRNLAHTGSTPAEKMKNIMRAFAGMLDNAISPYLYTAGGDYPKDYKEFVDESPKLKYVCECIASVKNYHEKILKNEASGQVIYLNRGKEFFHYIKEYLEKEVGYKANLKFNNRKIDEVEIITSSVSQEDREHIKDAFLEGTCKIIIGTASIREGIDLQRRGTVLYNCYPDWNPTDAKQLEGRIFRQGNLFGYVRIVMPLVQDSMDVFVFQKLEEKTSRVNDLFYRADRGNVLNVESLDPEDVKFAIYTNLHELAKIVIDKEGIEIKRKILIAEENIQGVSQLAYNIDEMNKYREDVKRQLLEAKLALKNFTDYVTMFPEKWNYPEAKLKEYTERSVELVKEIEQYTESIPQDDKVLISLINRLKASIYKLNNLFLINEWQIDKFKTAYSIVEKGKKTLMEAKGYSLDTDFAKVKEEFEKEKEQAETLLENTHSPEYINNIILQIQIKKEQNKVEGLEPEAAAMDFIKLNYLLKYPFDNIVAEQCELPKNDSNDDYSILEQNKTTKSKTTTYSKIQISKTLREIMPKAQLMAVDEWRGEAIEEMQPVMDILDKQVQNLNKSQSKKSFDELMVWAHYFYAGSDWYICEYEGNRILFGYAIINGDVQMSELGTVSVDDFDSIGMKGGGVQLDFYWQPDLLPNVLYKAYPNEFDKPENFDNKKQNQIETSEDDDETDELEILELEAEALLLLEITHQIGTIPEIELIYNEDNSYKNEKIKDSLGLADAFRNFYDKNKIQLQESFSVCLLSRQNKILGISILSNGGKSGTIVDVSYIVALAAKSNASAVAICHNHPSGNNTPSEEDLKITQKVGLALKLIDVTLLDHIILTKQTYYSFLDNGKELKGLKKYPNNYIKSQTID